MSSRESDEAFLELRSALFYAHKFLLWDHPQEIAPNMAPGVKMDAAMPEHLKTEWNELMRAVDEARRKYDWAIRARAEGQVN